MTTTTERCRGIKVLSSAATLPWQRMSHLCQESTGVYWKPVFYVLEEAVTCDLANAAHIAQVPGRKTDVKDCVWIAQLAEHGLVRGSFVPPAPIRDLRDLTRTRKALSQDRTRATNRLHKVLEDAGIKLASVANDVLGASGRAMLEALVAGTADPAVLAVKLPALRAVLVGRFRPHHAFLVSQLLAQLDFLEESMAQMSAQIADAIAPFTADLDRLDAIPGVSRRTAEVVISEIGVDMRQFPTAKHLASWAGLCPGQHESAGKRKPGTTRKGNRWLRTALVEAALSASRATKSALAARYRRVMRHHGHKKAVIAVVHAMLVARTTC